MNSRGEVLAGYGHINALFSANRKCHPCKRKMALGLSLLPDRVRAGTKRSCDPRLKQAQSK